MIVVDTSALIAILDREPDAALYAEAIAEADAPLISSATLLELHIVMLNRHGAAAKSRGLFGLAVDHRRRSDQGIETGGIRRRVGAGRLARVGSRCVGSADAAGADQAL